MASNILVFFAWLVTCSYFVNAIRFHRKAQGAGGTYEAFATANGAERATMTQRSSLADSSTVSSAKKGTGLMRFRGLGPPNDLCDALDYDNASFQFFEGPCVKLDWMYNQGMNYDRDLQRRLSRAVTKKVKHISLNMNFCDLTEAAAGTIADYLNRVATEQKATGDSIIETIEILLGKDNYENDEYPALGDDGLTKIANALKEFEGITTLRSIELAFQGHDGRKTGKAITDAGVTALIDALLGLRALVYLRLITMDTKITDVSLERYGTVYSNYKGTDENMFIDFRGCLATTGTARRKLSNILKEIGGDCEFDGENWQAPILFDLGESYTGLQNKKLQLHEVLDEFDPKFSPKLEVNLPYGKGAFSIEPSLPKGLTMDPRNGVIAGQPQAVHSSRTYTIKLVYDEKHVSECQLTFAV